LLGEILYSTRQSSHNALSTDLEILIRKLKFGTKARWKALAMQRDLVNIHRVCYVPHCWCWGRRVSGLYITATCCTPRHAPVFATPLTAGVGKKSVWSLHHCNSHMA
ncbi:3061_t:CDS:2, partial [Funneliformis mosseae]